MLVHDAYFKLTGYARQLTGTFNGAVAGLIYAGYLTSQMVAIRRLCDKRRDVISLRRSHLQRGLPYRARASFFATGCTDCDRFNLPERRFRAPGIRSNLARRAT